VPTSQGPDSQEPQALPTRQLLEYLRALLGAGQAPSPQEVAQALALAQDQVAALARGLDGAGQAGLAAYEQALACCMDLTLFRLELARAFGPAYLPLPGKTP